MAFSSRTANSFIASRTTLTVLPVRLPPADRVKSFLSVSSQHSSNCITKSLPARPVAWVYSAHRVVKYDQASLVPPEDMVGRRTFSTLAVVADWGGFWWERACMLRREAASEESTCSVTNVQFSMGH